MRTCSDGPGAGFPRDPTARNSEWTSQTACDRNARSKVVARNCGRPNRSRVKNWVIRQDEVFYHDRAALRETSVMNDGPNISSGAQPLQTEAQSSAPDFAAAVQPSYVRTVFLGSDGLRAGWGLAFYVAMLYPLQSLASRWAGSLDLDAGGLWSMMLEEFGVFLAAAVPALVLARVEKRSWGAYGLPGRQAFGKLFWAGAAWGFASITLLLATMYGLRVFDLGHLAIHGIRIVKFATFWAVMFLLVGLFEDFRFRGYLQFTLTRAMGFWPAAVLLSCDFGWSHRLNAGEHWTGLLAAAV